AWRSWLDNRANIETLQDPTVDAQAATAGLGRWRSFERNSLGSLETERLDGITDWSGTRYANGPGLSSVVLPDGSVSALSWSGRGLLEMDGTRSVAWTPDDQVASVTSAGKGPGGPAATWTSRWPTACAGSRAAPRRRSGLRCTTCSSSWWTCRGPASRA